MKILLFIVCVLIASIDGLVAIYSAMQRTVCKSKETVIGQNYPRPLHVKVLDILDADIVYNILDGVCQPSYPKVVCDNGGRTGRGNPHLTRNRYVVIASIDTQIERIIR